MAHVLERRRRAGADLEIISPAGFEEYFEQLTELLRDAGPPDRAALAQLAASYGLDLDFDSVPRLAQEYGLSFRPDAD